MKLNPAEYIIHIFGGLLKTARIIGRDHASVARWKTSIERGGTGGIIPSKAQQTIIKIAAEMGLDITASDLIFGRVVPTENLMGEKSHKVTNESEKTRTETRAILP